ncbi:MAG: hypothetical protein GY754_35800 [bacterium]|nr:hypothetical protein [bacterium]
MVSTHNSVSGAVDSKITEAKATATFRDIFYTYLQESYVTEDIQKMVFMPYSELLESPVDPDPANPLKGLQELYSNYAPSDLYEYGKEVPFNKIENVDGYFKKEKPVTFVVVPGIFGEFIDQRPFEEVLQAKGSFYHKWISQLKSNTSEVYSLADLAAVERTLDTMIDIASIDDSDGNALANLVLLKPVKGSLETFGTLDDNVQVYLKRLSKLYSIIDENETSEIYLIGYSRGLPVALDLLVQSRAQADTYSWSQKLKGVVGLAGVFYGSDLAEEAIYNPESPDHKSLQVVGEFVNGLSTEVTKEGIKNNLVSLNAAIEEVAAIQLDAALNKPAGLLLEKAQYETDLADPNVAVSYILKLASAYFELGDADISNILSGAASKNYSENIVRLKLLTNKVVSGIHTLTNQGRIEWWKNNIIPSDVKIFSLTGSMPDVTIPGEGFSDLISFPYYGANMADYQVMLRDGYYGVFGSTGVELNDSQITTYRARFWPTLGPVINPDQEIVRHYFLGCFGTHHWGFSFPFGLESGDQKENPFPRSIFFKSIAAYVSSID